MLFADASGIADEVPAYMRRIGCALVQLGPKCALELHAGLSFALGNEAHTVPRGELVCFLEALQLVRERTALCLGLSLERVRTMKK